MSRVLLGIVDPIERCFGCDLVLELPKNVAAECNPSNPEVALAALEAECTYILCNAIDVIAAWSKGGPPITTAADAEWFQF